MKSTLAIIGALIFAYFIFIIALMPANVAISWFNLPSNIKVGEVSGSVWQSDVSALQVDQLTIAQVNAKLSPWSLLMLAPSAELSFGERLSNGPQGNATFAISRNSINLSNSKVNIAASEIAALLPLPIPVEAFGQVMLTIESLAFADNQCQTAVGTIRWQRAAVRSFEQDIDLGEFTATLSCQDKRLAVTVEPNNRLGLNYTALVSLSGQLSGQGFIKPGNDFPKQLSQALPFLGNPDGQGRYQLKL